MDVDMFRSTPRRLHAALFACLACIGNACLADARSADGEFRDRYDSGARLQQVGEGVYAIIHADATEEWPHGNTGIVVGEDAVLVVDSTYLPARARADIALIRSITRKPVRYLVNTHWHGDHTHGNGVYRDVFPGIAIVGARGNAPLIALNQARYPRSALAPDSAKRKALAALQASRASGKSDDGKTLDAEALRKLDNNIRLRGIELAEFGKIAIAAPDLLFDGAMELDLGRRRVVLTDRGPGNSPHDVTILIPDQRILFTGDLVVHPVPFVINTSPRPWIATLRSIEAMPLTALVPGHGPVMHDLDYVAQLRNLLETAQSRVEAELLQGASLDEVQKRVKLEDLRAAFVPPDNADAAAQWDYDIKGLLKDTWNCSVGYNC